MSAKRAVIYARFSTDLQNENSVEDQIALCREYATRNGYNVVGQYFDKARSGASIFGRDGLLSLMENARSGQFETVIVEALDRLSRDQEDLAGLYKRLSFGGVEIVAVHDGTADAIQVGIRGLVSTLFLDDLKHKVRRGMSAVVRDGRHAGGKAYGYKPTPGEPGVMQIDEEEANVVRRIFEEILAGYLPREIATRLNRDGVAPPRGINWNASTIAGNATRGYGILRNPLYAGRIVWNRVKMVRDPDTGKRVSRPNPQSEWKEAEAPHLAIITQETQEEALRILSNRTRNKPGHKNTYRPKRILSGLLKCGNCGGGLSIHDRRKEQIRIKCTRAYEAGVCGNRRKYSLNKIEDAVISGLRAQLEHPEVLAEFVKAYREERRADADKATRERATVEKRLADVERQTDRLVQALARGTIPVEIIEKQLTPLQDEKRDLEARLAVSPAPPAIELHPVAVVRYREALENLSEHLNKIDPREDAEIHEVFRELVDSIVVHDTPGGGVNVEVVGHIAALVGKDAENWGGALVAEEGLEPPTRGL